jgi:three-Cys-motif partner protein
MPQKSVLATALLTMENSKLYSGREQTRIKHFILEQYLQRLAFKVLHVADLTYVDAFSGPWETRSGNFEDSSFMIAIEVLKGAQRELARLGRPRRIRCFFCERDSSTFGKLQSAVSPHNNPAEHFEIQTYFGSFTDAVSQIRAFVRDSFTLVFIDPTGWTGYDLPALAPLIARRKTEVIINFMYDFINRAAAMSDPKTLGSLDALLGGPEWVQRLDPELAARNRGMAVEKLFCENLKKIGLFQYVVSTKIYRPTIDRILFLLTYGTKDKKGLEVFRDVEYRARKQQAKGRSDAKERLREEATGSVDMFSGMSADIKVQEVDDDITQEELRGKSYVLQMLADGPKSFANLWVAVLERFSLRVTNVKDICVALARENKIEASWGGHNRKPKDTDVIKLKHERS